MTAYDETIAYLLGLEVARGWDLELERMRAALALRGNPERRFAAVHVAGTNGKGSTAAMVEAALRASGHRTGLYTSPHLVDFTERVRAGGRAIPRATVVALVAELRAALEGAGVALTHFEFVTLLAFEWYARIGVEVAVVEVGLGGRLDATNVLAPIATAITSIAYDHEEWLGDTLSAIAAEKAGIAKPAVPLVLGAVPPEAEATIRARAAEVGAPVVPAEALEAAPDGLAFTSGEGLRWDGLCLGLAGDFQRANAAVALALLAAVEGRFPCPVAAVRAGLASVTWPGRLAVLREAPRVVVDGAHNPAGVAALARELPALVGDRPVVLVFAVMADKAWRAMLDGLIPRARAAIVTRVGRRGLDPAALGAALAGRLPVTVEPDPRAAIRAGCAAAGAAGALVVTGSLFLVGEAYADLGGPGFSLFEPWQAWEGDGN